ncbi:DUF4255 domain-containing protein [Spirulina sp. CS-785/01]|uniref:DUF4255 domain-containing protein n=1 Tax=Spirulina sp. CS-785/01 TaxID=3021716 RepID=UPI00232E85B9|nr:DUF4255 domain-containing protein [Spirulina sp. CS-785/01]MDB9315296.1 DUF4255 domain-containing protein [Spirulina sp. CS-785/01]
MLDDLDSSLRAFLHHELPELQNSGETQVAISFDLPVEDAIQQTPAINLFLYDVRENLERRNREWRMQRQDNGTAIKTQPPARVDCSYLITAWSSGDDPQQEHHILSRIMRLLLRRPVLPDDLLQGSLQDPICPVLLTSLQPGIKNPGEIWQALGGLPKVSLHCTVTIPVPRTEDPEEVPLVLEHRPQLSRFS